MLDVELQSRKLEVQREEELQLVRSKEKETSKAKSSRVPSVSSRAASKRRGSSVISAERMTTSKKDITVHEATVKKRLSITKGTKKATGKVFLPKTGQSSFVTSTTTLLSRMQAYMAMSTGPFSMLQTIVMLMVIAWMTNNKRMRDRIRRILADTWVKISRIVGMGIKVTYV